MSDDLYWKDIVGWSAVQADRLRRLARGERVNDVDWENVIEELESVGRSELKSVRSLLTRAFEHALKIHGWPGNEAVDHWYAELDAFWRDARRGMDPGMAQHLDLPELFAEAREAVLRLRTLPAPERSLPTGIALEPRDVRTASLSPDDLLARLTGP